MKNIGCFAGSCAYNQAGQCSAPVMNIAEKITEQGGEAYCDTYTKGEHAPLSMENSMTTSAYSGWEFPRHSSHPAISCCMKRCVHNKEGGCGAPVVEITAPARAFSDVCMCNTFTKLGI